MAKFRWHIHYEIGVLDGSLGPFEGLGGTIWWDDLVDRRVKYGKGVWHIGGPPKLSHFLWRACTGALATKGQLYARHIVGDAICSRWGHASDTIIHAISRCSLVSPIWDLSPFSRYVEDAPDSSFMELFVWIKEKLEAPDF